MKRSTERILTTHTGSLPRPPPVVELMLHEQNNPGAKAAELKAAVRGAVADVVAKQVACRLDVINDGEQGRTDYTTHVKDRLTGFDGPSSPPLGTGEPDFPELSAMLAYFAGDGRRRSGGRLLHLAVAGADRALPQEPALPERGSLSLRARRRDGARIPRHRGRWPRAAARL